MANTSVGTIAISLSLWLADLGAAKVEAPEPAAPVKTCHAAARAPADPDSDLEVLVCAPPRQP